MTLADFETLVLSQQPATTPWQPVTDYSFEARKAIEGQHPQLILEVFQPASIVDVGCGFKYLVNLLNGLALLNGFTDKPIAMGVDVSNLAADLQFDIAGSEPFWGHQRELVICREVLEHLTVRQIAKAVRNLCALSTKYVYVTTRFNTNAKTLLDVQTSDDLDPTHISLLHQDLLRTLFVLEGFKRRADLEQRLDWKHLDRCLVYERV